MVGVYKVVSKKDPQDFYIIGSANIETYWQKNGDENYTYLLIREVYKFELKRYEEHFKKRFVPKKKEKVTEAAVIAQPVTENAVIPEKKPRKKRVASKSKK